MRGHGSQWISYKIDIRQCCLAGSSKMAPRIFISSIVLGAENLSDMKLIETHARAFLALIILSISSVRILFKAMAYKL